MRGRLLHIWRTYRGVVLMGALGIPIGVAVGALDALFGHGLSLVTALREGHAWLLTPLLPLAGIPIVWAYRRHGRNTARGMGLVFDVGHGHEGSIPLRLVPLAVGSTWLTHLFGGSAGREGVAVQIGATVSHWTGRRLPFARPGNTFLVVGMAAGFAGLFRTPLAATAFALEVLTAGHLEYSALFPALTAALAASATSGALGLTPSSFDVGSLPALDAALVGRLALLGVAFGVAGGAFAWCLARAKQIAANRFASPYARVVLLGCVAAALLLALGAGRYSGLGTNLIVAGVSGDLASLTPVDWLLKGALTILTLAAGFQGGEVTPLFSVGASLGAVLAGAFGLPVGLVAALGYAAVFGSGTNTLLAPILIGCEVFGYDLLPAFFIVSSVAYLFNMDKSIYTLQERE